MDKRNKMSINLKNLKNKNIHIVGIGGAEGSAVAEFLVVNNISSITGHDFSLRKDFKKNFYNTHLSLKLEERKKALEHLLNLPIKINFKDHYLEGIEEADLVFVSQVWFKYSQNLPILQNLKNSGVPFKTITNLYFELAPCKIISVTGTNGKTTTARLINSIFSIWATSPSFPLSGEGIISSLLRRERLANSLSGNKKGLSSSSFPDKGGWGVKPKIYFAGNDRQNVQVLDKLNEMTKNDILILETSSTQLLLNSGISPRIGVITNITPNHLDDHGSFENYIEAKKNLIRYQKAEDWAVLNYDNKETRKIADESKIKNQKSKIFLFSRKEELEEGCFVKDDNIVVRATPPSPLLSGREHKDSSLLSGWEHHKDTLLLSRKEIISPPLQREGLASSLPDDKRGLSSSSSLDKERVSSFSPPDKGGQGGVDKEGWESCSQRLQSFSICNISDIKIPGKHNLENVLAAVSVAYLYGVEPEIIKKGIINYTGIKHRLKLLYNIDGIKYYDDTQATTPEATIAGIESFDSDIILLAGGDNKGMDYKKLAEKINDRIKLLILFPGNASDEIEKLIDKKKIDFKKVNDFSGAVNFLREYLKNKKTPSVQLDTKCPDVVLISPAAAHFYSKYVENTNKNLKEWIKLMKQ